MLERPFSCDLKWCFISVKATIQSLLHQDLWIKLLVNVDRHQERFVCAQRQTLGPVLKVL